MEKIVDIVTVFKTTDHKVIASRYERCMYGEPEQMLIDFENDVNLQFDTYAGIIDLFAVVVKGEEETNCEAFEQPTPEAIIEYVENLAK